MADMLSSLLAFPPPPTVKITAKEWDRQAHAMVTDLSKIPTATWMKIADKQNVLDLLNPAINTLPYLFALLAHVSAAGKDRERVEHAATRSIIFFASFDRIQVRYAGKEWRSLLDWAFDTYPRLGIRDFTPLTTAMLRLDPSAGTFTTAHLSLVRACLHTAVPSQALPILDKNIVSFPPTPPPKTSPDDNLLCNIADDDDDDEQSNTYITTASQLTYPLKPEHILEYNLHAATIYLGQRNYPRARLFLEYILLHPSPTHTPSALQAEAYKKHILLCLLSHGRNLGVPRTHDAALLRSLRATARAYEALASTFEARDWRKFQAQVDFGAGVWADDGNARLVKEVGDALLRFRVRDLEGRFVALGVGKVGQILGLAGGTAGAVKVLEEVLGSGAVKGAGIVASTENGGEPVLRFDLHTPSPANTNPPAVRADSNGVGAGERDADTDLAAATTRIEALTAALRDADRRLQLTKEYIEFQRRRKRVAAASGGAGAAGAPGSEGELAEQMDLSWDAPIVLDDDEDEEDALGMGVGMGMGGAGGRGFEFGEEGEEDIMGA